ncbi:tRNA-dihydrouridine synthase [Candidatus Dojkabacteria bacterium]|uniref:tRNA-dihydrouridine synthase n=1 Tax=Candidatus Dojkabacteria bacterium TaxID=2099670 RepID=A0A955RJL9_9BACT|nr:tRNA-dihydrouridine synthase [Candidatus Dojkabacteria bacterium]
MNNFWQAIEKPIIGLAPMDGVTDAPFRFITSKHSNPDVIITEFISVDGIAYGAGKLFTDFLYHEMERPVVAQVFGNDPELFYIAAKVVCELGFDGLDINMGCPAKSVSSRGAGAALIKTPDLAREIILSSKQGVDDWVRDGTAGLSSKVIKAIEATKIKLKELGVSVLEERQAIPVSVKTRIGFNQSVVEDWIRNLLLTKPTNITVHGRTLKQMYTGGADWAELKKGGLVVKEYNKSVTESEQITYLGNGDVKDYASFIEKVDPEYFDGVLMGRGAFGNPWLFEMNSSIKAGDDYHKSERSFEEIKQVINEHCKLHWQIKGEKAFVQMRKHLAWYVKGMPGASELRRQLMSTKTPDEVEDILDNYS